MLKPFIKIKISGFINKKFADILDQATNLLNPDFQFFTENLILSEFQMKHELKLTQNFGVVEYKLFRSEAIAIWTILRNIPKDTPGVSEEIIRTLICLLDQAVITELNLLRYNKPKIQDDYGKLQRTCYSSLQE